MKNEKNFKNERKEARKAKQFVIQLSFNEENPSPSKVKSHIDNRYEDPLDRDTDSRF